MREESESKSPGSSVEHEKNSHHQSTKCFLLEENKKLQRDIQNGRMMIKELGEIIHDILSSIIVAESAYEELYITYKIELVKAFEEKYEWVDQCCFCEFEESKQKLHDCCFKEGSANMNDIEKLLSQLLSISSSFENTFPVDNLGQTEDSEIYRLWSELSLARQQITSLEVDKAQAFNEINDLKQIDEHTKSDFEDLQQKYERSQRSLRSLEKVLGEKDEGDEDDEVQVLRTEVVELKRRVDELEDEKSRARKEVVDLEFDLKKVNDKIASLKNKRPALIRGDNHSDIPFQVDIRHFDGPQLLNGEMNLVSKDVLHTNETDGTLLGAMWSSLSLNREKISCLEKKNNFAKQRLNVLKEKQPLLKGSPKRSLSINCNSSLKGTFPNTAVPNSVRKNGFRKKNERNCPKFASARNAKAA